VIHLIKGVLEGHSLLKKLSSLGKEQKLSHKGRLLRVD